MPEPQRLEVEIDYEPRPQFRSFHERRQRWAIIVAHRRAGKTVACVLELIFGALRSRRLDGRYAYIAPYFSQAKDVAWQYLQRYTAAIPGVSYHESELRADLPNGSRVRLYGADNPERLRGLYLDGVICDEMADWRPGVWQEVLRPALSDRRGWAVFIGTPRGKNEFWRLWEQAGKDEAWYRLMLRASETGILSADELAEARRLMSPEQYDQEFECSFQAALVGSYYGALLAQAEAEGRIGRVPHDPSERVHTAWDLGIGDSTAIWFCQRIGREIRLIDYYESSGAGLDHYVRQMQARPYVYGVHYLPHDAGANQLATGISLADSLRKLGVEGTVLPRGDLEEGINAARMLIPQCWFDSERCERGLEALRQYRRDWDAKGQTFRARPLHDWTSHAADAFRYLAVGLEYHGIPSAGVVSRPGWQRRRRNAMVA
jgi:hypothetical protein